jgi:hypothetical protein
MNVFVDFSYSTSHVKKRICMTKIEAVIFHCYLATLMAVNRYLLEINNFIIFNVQ